MMKVNSGIHELRPFGAGLWLLGHRGAGERQGIFTFQPAALMSMGNKYAYTPRFFAAMAPVITGYL